MKELFFFLAEACPQKDIALTIGAFFIKAMVFLNCNMVVKAGTSGRLTREKLMPCVCHAGEEIFL